MELYDQIRVEQWTGLRRVVQHYPRPQIGDIRKHMKQKLAESETLFKPGERVAVAVGSRSIQNLATIVKIMVEKLKTLGAHPYVISAMGSHGGATSEGQKEVLDSLGITPSAIGVPVVYDTEWTCIGKTKDDMPVYFSKRALTDDAIVLINRVKRHTNFRGSVESGIVKMAVVGLGKHKGALTIHSGGFEDLSNNLISSYDVVFSKTPIRMAIAIVENAYGETAWIELIPAERILTEEKKLLIVAKQNEPRIPFSHIDVLVVHEMGKDISGDGMDPNITGRFSSSIIPDYKTTPKIVRLSVLDLTEGSHGSAVGVGYADFITKRLMDKVIPMVTYTNAITATAPESVKIPPVMPDDRRAIEAAFRTCPNVNMDNLRLCIIHNTHELNVMYVSEPQLDEISCGADIEIDPNPYHLDFNSAGALHIKGGKA